MCSKNSANRAIRRLRPPTMCKPLSCWCSSKTLFKAVSSSFMTTPTCLFERFFVVYYSNKFPPRWEIRFLHEGHQKNCRTLLTTETEKIIRGSQTLLSGGFSGYTREFADSADKQRAGSGQGAIATVNNPQLAP